jgi:hypothetical protein
MKTKIAKYNITALVLLISFFSYTQKKPGFIPPSIDDEEIPILKSELPLPEEGKDYVVQYFKGITDGEESRIAIKKLGYIIRPAMVQVISEDGRELAIELVKKHWDDVVRSGKTRDGKFQNSFKTAMEFGIKISAKETGIPFIVAVSAGVELFPASNLFVDAGTMRSSSGTEDNTIENVGAMTEENSRSSNNTLLIIIAVALVVIVGLLAFFIFKKKGKATSILLFFIISSSYAGLPTQVFPAFDKTISGAFLDALHQHYLNGGFNNDHPLNDDDKDHEPDVDPRGQPSLPSSCYEIARMGNPRFSGGGSGSGPTGAKNPDNAGSGPTLNTGTGGLAGGIGDSETSTDSGNGKDNDIDLSVEQQVENATKDLERDRRETLNSFDIGLRRQMQNYENILQGTRETYQEQKTQAEGNPERQRNLADELLAREKELGEMNAARVEELKTIRDNNLELASKLYNDRLLEIMRRANEREREQQNNDGGEKDPNREPKKDPDREEEKGVDSPGDTDKGVDSPGDTEDGSENGGAEDRRRNREKEAGCTCLEEAYAELQKQRYSLEKLLKIGQHTKKVTDFGISFGDNFSGVHGVSGLVWQTERAKVIKSIENFDITYNNKYEELIQKLYNALIRIDECEKILGYENWYSHSGFIYYEFMKVRYASYK